MYDVLIPTLRRLGGWLPGPRSDRPWRPRWCGAHLLVPAGALLLAGAFQPALATELPGEGDELAEVALARERVYPALVNISVVMERYHGGRAQRGLSGGSGVIVSPEGHVLTNYHVVGHARRITCRLATGETFEAEVVGHDPLTDLSVIRLHLAEGQGPLTYATLGDSDALEVGDAVLAMGNPFFLASSMTLGIVSNSKRVFTDPASTELRELDFGDGEVTGLLTQWLQHDALILPGNSGGPLVNLRGEVVGINARGGIGVGFAIPSAQAAHVLESVLRHGEVPRAWLDIRALPVDKLGRAEGTLVAWVMPESPAERAGLRAGDLILRVGGQAADTRFFEQVPAFYALIADQPIGAKTRLEVLRGSERLEVEVVLERMEPFVGDEVELRELGATLREITRPMAVARRLATTEGLYVTGVRPGHPFEEARPQVRAGDVITELDGRPVASLASLRELTDGIEPGRPVGLVLQRQREQVVTVVELAASERSRRGGQLPRSWLGLRTQVLTPPVARAMGIEGTRGFRVTEVFPDTRAAQSGLRTGDVITAVAGVDLEAFRTQDAEELRRLVEDFPIGDSVELTVVRGGREESIPVSLEATPLSAADAERAEQVELDFTVRELTFMDRIDEGWPAGVEGVMVTDVASGGWANVAGLRHNDLIASINDQTVNGVERFQEVIDSVVAERPEVVRLFVHRGPRTHFVFIEPDWKKVLE